MTTKNKLPLPTGRPCVVGRAYDLNELDICSIQVRSDNCIILARRDKKRGRYYIQGPGGSVLVAIHDNDVALIKNFGKA